MDVVTNHTADVIQLDGNAGYRNKTDFPYVDVNGDPFDDSDFAYYGQSPYTFPEVDDDELPVPADRCRPARRRRRTRPGSTIRCSITTAATPASPVRTRSTATSSVSTISGPNAKKSSTG